MEQSPHASKTGLHQPRATPGTVFVQLVLGLILQFVLALPFLRRTHGLERLRPDRRQ